MNLKRQMDRSKKRKRQKELRKQFLVVSTKIRSTGSFVEWNEDAEWEVVRFGVGCSFISSVAKFLSALRSLFIFIPIWVPRDLSVRDASNTKKRVQVNLKPVVG
jgi:hypothetical protein